MSTAETRARLMEAAVRLTSREGMRAATARAVAAEAGVNQALVFYHFDGLDGLLREAYAAATSDLIAGLVEELEGATTFAELHEVGTRLSARSREDGSAALLAHAVSAAHTDEEMARTLASLLQMWETSLTASVRRVLAHHGLEEAVDVGSMSRAIAASSIGMITLDAVPGQPLGQTLPSLAGVARVVDRASRLVPAPLVRRLFAHRAGRR